MDKNKITFKDLSIGIKIAIILAYLNAAMFVINIIAGLILVRTMVG